MHEILAAIPPALFLALYIIFTIALIYAGRRIGLVDGTLHLPLPSVESPDPAMTAFIIGGERSALFTALYRLYIHGLIRIDCIKERWLIFSDKQLVLKRTDKPWCERDSLEGMLLSHLSAGKESRKPWDYVSILIGYDGQFKKAVRRIEIGLQAEGLMRNWRNDALRAFLSLTMAAGVFILGLIKLGIDARRSAFISSFLLALMTFFAFVVCLVCIFEDEKRATALGRLWLEKLEQSQGIARFNLSEQNRVDKELAPDLAFAFMGPELLDECPGDQMFREFLEKIDVLHSNYWST